MGYLLQPSMKGVEQDLSCNATQGVGHDLSFIVIPSEGRLTDEWGVYLLLL